MVSRRLAVLAIVATTLTASSSWATENNALRAAVSGPARTMANVSRDTYRHPYESLSFWGLKPGDTILEIWPGGGYWTEILAPYAKATGGKYIAATEGGGPRPFPARFADKSVYGDITTAVFNKDTPPMVPAGTADFVLTSRNIHDWVGTPGFPEKAFRDFYAALKPGGILAVEQHRSDPRPMKPNGSDGYLSTAYVVKLATDAGFRLDGQSEINANPKDTKDHPFGVWTLPPTRRSAPSGQPANPDFDHTKYDAIGESDRMTLRFKKPG